MYSKQRYKRQQRKSILAFGEAQTEKAFLRHLKIVYRRQQSVAVKVECGKGGSPTSVVKSAIKYCSAGSYEVKFILLDTDIPWDEEMINEALTNNLNLIPAEPCIEGFFLSLLKKNFDPQVHTSRECKKMFENEFLNGTEKLDHRNYSKIFPESELEIMRKTNTSLDSLIRMMTDG